ncbi:MAG: DUF488 family protein [Proteobacteria bacterium]|nr:DUF488 family protein [Pseudomonadota bacterium]MDE3207974.1 DUF488 family protein [Pseudomonadota bacterium]
MSIATERIYDESTEQGFRVLVDRLWPRGIKKGTAKIDLWLRDIAPSNELRRWFAHNPERFEVFRLKYEQEILSNPVLEQIKVMMAEKELILVYAARDKQHNNAVVLAQLLSKI